MKVAYVFPGQGAQRVGMGHDLYRTSPRARAVFEEADAVLGCPLTELCFGGPEDVLCQTINAQPAILATSIAYLKATPGLWDGDGADPPAFVAGHSLGEYTALVAAKVLDFADALRLARERGRLMHEAGERMPGGMAAIIGLDEATVEQICQETGVEIANVNSPGQIGISGSKESLASAMELAKARGAKRAILLEVSGAFHSALMQSAVEGTSRAIAGLTFRDPVTPIVGNTTAQPLTTAEAVKAELVDQLCHCVRWQKSVEYMIDAGVSTFLEIGPGQVLTGLIKRIDGKVQTVGISEKPPAGP